MQLSDLFENVEMQGTIHVFCAEKGHEFDITATDEPWAFNDYEFWYVNYMWAEDDQLNIEVTIEQ